MAATYIVIYENKNGNPNTEYISAANAQSAVDYIRNWEGEDIYIKTVAKVVNNWKYTVKKK